MPANLILGFDYFNFQEIPVFILCNPNKEKLYSLGGISERKYSPRYNTLSEISFRADQFVDEMEMEYYNYITNRRLVYVVGIGYFMITEVNESNDGISKYKEVVCQSLEVELSSRKLTGYVSGSGIWEGEELISTSPIPLNLTQLYGEIKQYLSGWEFDENIPITVDAKFRSFDVSDTTLYNLLMVDVEEAFNCVFDFDSENKLIFSYDADDDIELTDIFISHDNVIKSMSITEVTDELVTCLYVVGGGGLDISWVNPLGNNYIYNFDYFKSTEWMSESLIDAINTWEIKIEEASPIYAWEVLNYFNDYDQYTAYFVELTTISGSARTLQTQYDTYLGSGNYFPDDPMMVVLHNQLIDLYISASAVQQQVNDTLDMVDAHFEVISSISEGLKLDNLSNFTTDQQNQLQPFIIQSSYVNDNIIRTENMTSGSVLMQAASLYEQATGVLQKSAQPKYNFEIDAVNFLQIKELEKLGEQLSLGKKITLEIEPGRYIQTILLGIDLDFDNPGSFKLIFGNRLRLNDETFQFNDLMTKALDAGTSINLNSQAFHDWTRDYKSQYQNLASGMKVKTVSPSDLASGLNLNSVSPDVGIDVNPAIATETTSIPSVINFKSNQLLWNGVPLSGTGGSTIIINGSPVTISSSSAIKITLFSGGVSVNMYTPTSIGLSSAISAAREGDVVFIPDTDITGDFYIPYGINLVGISSRESIIRGTITVEPKTLLENLSVINEGSDDTDLVSVIAQETTISEEITRIKGCDIRCYQCGTGDTTAIYISGSGVDLTVENSTIIADSNGGNGYTFTSNNGNCNVYHSNYYGKTEVFHDGTIEI